MKLAVLIAALCASCTAITLAPERSKPQLQRANKVLALRGGGAGSVPAPAVGANPIVQFFVQLVSVALNNNQPGLIAIFVWSLPYVIGAIPGVIGKFAQQFFFAAYYVSEDEMDIKHVARPRTSAGGSYSFWARLRTPQSSCLPSTRAHTFAFACAPPSGR